MEFVRRQWLQVRAFLRHLRRHFDLGVEVADAFRSLVSHPLTVVPNILGQSLRSLPFFLEKRVVFPDRRVHGRLPCELWRYLNHRLIDKYRHGIQVAGVSLQAQSLRLQWQSTTPSKWVVEGR